MLNFGTFQTVTTQKPELNYLEVADVSNHVGEERVSGNVEWHSKRKRENVAVIGTSPLSYQLSFRWME